VIRVCDTGPGIGADDCEKIFDDFYTTKPQGLGLGLSISKTLVRSHGGELAVEPSEQGAVLRVTLPGMK
jgi:two-component system sensor kinase FixL